LSLDIINIRHSPHLINPAANYFSSKWNVAKQVYHDSISDSITTQNPLPRWFLMMDGEEILGSFGLIENDFMKRTDLSPWICAIYIEEHLRGNNLGSALLEHGRKEAAALGFTNLYLCTDHVGYYEKYGWQYIGNEESTFGDMAMVYTTKTNS